MGYVMAMPEWAKKELRSAFARASRGARWAAKTEPRAYCWRFVDGRPKVNRWRAMRQTPATSRESEAFSKDLKHRGFSFVGPTVVYAYMQAIGMVVDHLIDCYRYREILRKPGQNA